MGKYPQKKIKINMQLNFKCNEQAQTQRQATRKAKSDIHTWCMKKTYTIIQLWREN